MSCGIQNCLCNGSCERRVTDFGGKLYTTTTEGLQRPTKAQQLREVADQIEENRKAEARRELVVLYNQLLPEIEKAATKGDYRLSREVTNITSLFIPDENIFTENGFKVRYNWPALIITW